MHLQTVYGCFVPQRQGWVILTDTVRPAKPKINTTWPLTEKLPTLNLESCLLPSSDTYIHPITWPVHSFLPLSKSVHWNIYLSPNIIKGKKEREEEEEGKGVEKSKDLKCSDTSSAIHIQTTRRGAMALVTSTHPTDFSYYLQIKVSSFSTKGRFSYQVCNEDQVRPCPGRALT